METGRWSKHKQHAHTSLVFTHQRKDEQLNNLPAIQCNTRTRGTNTEAESVHKLYPFLEYYPSFSEATGEESKGEIHAKWNGK